MSPQFVKPYVKSNKNDVADADAIAEASARPSMRFVGVKSVEQECIQQVHRARQMALKHLTAQRNQLHGFLLEYGIASSKGTGALLRLLPEVLEDGDNELSVEGRTLLRELDELRHLHARVQMFDRQLEATARRLKACQRLMTIPGVGEKTATALVAAVGDATQFRNARDGRLARSGAAAAHDGRSTEAARHQQARRPLSAHAADPRRSVGAAAGGAVRGPSQSVGGGCGATPRSQRGGGGVGEQERAHGMGGAAQRAGLRCRTPAGARRGHRQGGMNQTTGHGAGNTMAAVASSRGAAPPLRYGPAGDPTAAMAQRLVMAVSKLPAITGPAHQEH